MQKLLINLESQQTGAKPFDGMAAGSFVDMMGRKLTLRRDDFPEFVANTNEIIQATADTTGAPVGLPIDQRGHIGDLDAAGWIIKVELSASGDKIIFYPRWTPVGENLIKNNLQRFFSPTLDLTQKVIVGGSLTNWPATRGKKNKNLLKPVELSMSDETLVAPDEATIAACTAAFAAQFPDIEAGEIAVMADHIEIVYEDVKYGIPYTMSEDGTYIFPPQEEWTVIEPEAPGEAPAPEAPMSQPAPEATPAVVQLTAEQITQLDTVIEDRVQLRLSALLAEKERANRVSTFSLSMVSKGLPIQATELGAFLASLSDEQLTTAERILSRVVTTGLVPLSELGHAQTMTGTKPLPALIANSLKGWVANRGEVAEFFKVNAVELGSMADYDLSAYAPKEG